MPSKVMVIVSENYPDKPPMDLIRDELEGCEVDQYEYSDVEELRDVVPGYDAVVLRTPPLPDGIYEEAPDLKIVSVGSSGVDGLDIGAATEHDVAITNNPEAHSPTVSEGVIALMLALIRDLPTQIQLAQDNEWERAREVIDYNVPLLEYSTIGVVGLGEIGFGLAKKGTVLFDEVLGYDPYLVRYDRETVEDQGVEMVEDLTELFEQSDVVSIHTPLTDETRGFIGKTQLESLGSDGYLINASRGGVIEEEELIQAITDETIRGAAVDVLRNEPPSPDHPLLDAENAIVTPHRAGIGKRPPEINTYRLSAKKVNTRLNGSEPENVINPDALSELT